MGFFYGTEIVCRKSIINQKTNMVKKYFLLLVLAPLLVLSQTKQEKKEALQKQKMLFSVKPLQKGFIETIAFDDSFDQIIVPVKINGKTYNFMFDTGAVTVLSASLREELLLQPLFSNDFRDGSGTVQQQQIYSLPPVQLGTITFSNVSGAVIDMSKFSKMFCIKIDGIFGTNIMRTCRWKIDYTNKQLTFSDKKIKPSGKVLEIDFEEGFSGSPMLNQRMGGYSFQSIMDTGYNGMFSLPDSLFFKSTKAKALKAHKIYGKSSLTLFDDKPTTEHLVLLDSIYIGKHLIKNKTARIEGNMLLIGNKFFKDFGEVILDWEKQKVYLADVSVKEDKECAVFGFTPLRTDAGVSVGTLWENSNAQQLGMELGDAITDINGISVTNAPQEIWCTVVALFKEDTAQEISVSIRKKDGSQKSLLLKKYNAFH
jgi:hypothetical protein